MPYVSCICKAVFHIVFSTPNRSVNNMKHQAKVLWYFIYLQQGTKSHFPCICSNLLCNLDHAAIWNNLSFPLRDQDSKKLYPASFSSWIIPFITNGFHRERTHFWYVINYTAKLVSFQRCQSYPLNRIELGTPADNNALLLSLSFHTSSFRFVSRVELGFSTRSFLSTPPPTPVSPLFIPVPSRLFLFPFQLLVTGAFSLDVIASTTWRLGIFQQMSELVISKQARLKESN